jgi:type II secretory pathway component PulC
MASSKSQTGRSAANVQPVVVMLGNVEMSCVLGGVVIAVPDERGFKVIVKVRVRNRYPLGCVSYVHEPIVVIFAMVEVGGELALDVLATDFG